MIRPATTGDASRITGIYNHYVRSTIVTFDEEPIKRTAVAARIADTVVSFPYLVEEENGHVRAFAYASPWKSRGAYRQTAETTIYLDPECTGLGIGSRLYTQLIEALRERGIHALLGGIALPNPASIALHEKLGFTKVAQLKEVGRKFGRWIDVGYWELIL